MNNYEIEINIPVEYKTRVDKTESSNIEEAARIAIERDVSIPYADMMKSEDWVTDGPWEFPNIGIKEPHEAFDVDEEETCYYFTVNVTTPFKTEVQAESENEAIEISKDREIGIYDSGMGDNEVVDWIPQSSYISVSELNDYDFDVECENCEDENEYDEIVEERKVVSFNQFLKITENKK